MLFVALFQQGHRKTREMANYIIIAHPTEFVCRSFEAYAPHYNLKAYCLEPEDDINYLKLDLKPVAFIAHPEFQHQTESIEDITQRFKKECKVQVIGLDIIEPFNIDEVLKNLIA